MSDSSSLKRRQILSGLMKILVFIGLVFITIPFVSSFSSNSIDEKKSAKKHWVINVPLSDLKSGKVSPLSWSGGHVWVYARTKKDIIFLKKDSIALRDALSNQSEQPGEMKNNFRSMSENYFVFIPIENKRGCQVSLYDETNESEEAVFTEPCFGAKYDAAGRILKNSGHLEQQNLAVPEHVIEDGTLKIGIWMPKI